MKKTQRLTLHRETLRSLSAQSIAGGMRTTLADTLNTFDATCYSEFPCGSGSGATLSDLHQCFSDSTPINCIPAY